jgi:hypothetical protein
VKEDIAGKIIHRLAKQEKEEGNLPLLLEFYRKLVQLQTGVQEHIVPPVPAPDREDTRRRIGEGLPLIGIGDLTLDWPLVQDVFARVRALFAGYTQLFGDTALTLKSNGCILTGEAVEAWFTGKRLPPALVDGTGENLMLAVIQATMQPFLASFSRALIGFVEQERWRRGYCPICGGSPDLAFLKGDIGARWLLCSRCDTEWLFQRLECPYCGTQEQNALVFFTDDAERYRLYVCERCKCYLKAIDLRKTEGDVPLPLERLYTLDLDAQARERGYRAFRNLR